MPQRIHRQACGYAPPSPRLHSLLHDRVAHVVTPDDAGARVGRQRLTREDRELTELIPAFGLMPAEAITFTCGRRWSTEAPAAPKPYTAGSQGSTTMKRLGRFLCLGMTARCVVACVVLTALPATSAQTPSPDPFTRVNGLIGRWEGMAEGQPGKGTVRREYSKVLNGRFIRVQNRSEYPAQEKNPEGEIHEDEGFLSFDRRRKALMLRQFHVEGFVNQYVKCHVDARSGGLRDGGDRKHPARLACPRRPT